MIKRLNMDQQNAVLHDKKLFRGPEIEPGQAGKRFQL